MEMIGKVLVKLVRYREHSSRVFGRCRSAIRSPREGCAIVAFTLVARNGEG